MPKTPTPPRSQDIATPLRPTLWVHAGDEKTGAPRESALLLTRLTNRGLRAPALELSATYDRVAPLSDWDDLPVVCLSSLASDIVIAYPVRARLLQELALMAARCGCRFHVATTATDAADAGIPAVGTSRTRVVLTAPRSWTRIAPSDSEVFSPLRRAVDIVGALAAVIVVLPLVLAAGIGVCADSRGAPLFVQTRIGHNGRPFSLFKIRTMHRTAPPFARSPTDGDLTVTRFGRLLRATGLDEIPQLLNILRGDMTFVGPRPEMPFVVAQYTPLQRERLAVRPGLTGLWQLRGDRHSAIHNQIEYDLYYIAFRSLALDARLLAETAMFAIRGGMRALRPKPLSRDTVPTLMSKNATSGAGTTPGE